jgi:hypothetical protein
MPRPKRVVATSKTAFDIYNVTGLVRDRAHALELFRAGRLRMNGKPVHPDTPLGDLNTLDFSVEIAGQIRGIAVKREWL